MLISLFASNTITYLLDIIIIPHGRHNGPQLFINHKVTSHSRQRRENIGKQNAPIRLIVAPGLQRDFHGHLRYFGSLSKGGVLLTEIAVLLNVTTSLSHHPYWSAFDFFAAGGSNEQWILCGRSASLLAGLLRLGGQ